jgi:hypothetical protein
LLRYYVFERGNSKGFNRRGRGEKPRRSQRTSILALTLLRCFFFLLLFFALSAALLRVLSG